jgi:hypothetical protein
MPRFCPPAAPVRSVQRSASVTNCWSPARRRSSHGSAPSLPALDTSRRAKRHWPHCRAAFESCSPVALRGGASRLWRSPRAFGAAYPCRALLPPRAAPCGRRSTLAHRSTWPRRRHRLAFPSCDSADTRHRSRCTGVAARRWRWGKSRPAPLRKWRGGGVRQGVPQELPVDRRYGVPAAPT